MDVTVWINEKDFMKFHKLYEARGSNGDDPSWEKISWSYTKPALTFGQPKYVQCIICHDAFVRLWDAKEERLRKEALQYTDPYADQESYGDVDEYDY